MVRQRDFGHHIFTHRWDYQNCLIPHGNPAAPPLGENIDSCISVIYIKKKYSKYMQRNMGVRLRNINEPNHEKTCFSHIPLVPKHRDIRKGEFVLAHVSYMLHFCF